MHELERRLAAGDVLILDGGTGTELERRGVPMNDVAWCGPALLQHRDVVRDVHADYIRAGADIVITNTFATMPYMLEAAGLGAQADEINTIAAEAALRAREQAAGGRTVFVAGSFSPMSPGGLSENRPPLAKCAEDFARQARVLARAGVDLFMLEMMRDIDYTAAAIEAAKATGLPVWVGFSCRRAADGSIVMVPAIEDEMPLAEVIAPAMQAGGSLVSIMHSEVEDTPPALEIVRQHWPGPVGAYPHSGHFAMPHWQFDAVVSPADFLAAAEGWVAQGAQVVGGCCGIGPAHIRLLSERLAKRV